MADIELIIKIPEEVYEEIKNGVDIEIHYGEHIVVKDTWASEIIKNGTPLPKGHGDLIDRNELIENGINKGFCDWYDEIKSINAIIESNKAESEE